MSTDGQSPAYEIGHFQIENVRNLSDPYVKYIVESSKDGMRLVLHADEGEETHLGVAMNAKVDPEAVIGGGNIAWATGGIRLQGRSARFHQEDVSIRTAFHDVVWEKLRDRIARFLEEAPASVKE